MKRLIIFTLILTGVISGIMSGSDQLESKSSPSINYDLIEKTYSVKGMNGSFPTPLIYLNSYVNSQTPYKDATNFNKLLVSMLNHGSYPFGRNYLVFVDTINTISIGNYALLDLTKNGNVDFSKKNLVIPYFNTNRAASYPKDLDDLDKDIIDIGNEPKGIKVMTYKFKKKEQYNNILNYTKQFYDLMRNAWVLFDFQGYMAYYDADIKPHFDALKQLLNPSVDPDNVNTIIKTSGDRYSKILQIIKWILDASIINQDNADMGSINMKDFIEAHEKELNLRPFRDEILREYKGDSKLKTKVKEVLAYKPLVLFIRHIVALYDAIIRVGGTFYSQLLIDEIQNPYDVIVKVGMSDESHTRLVTKLLDYYAQYSKDSVGDKLSKFFAVLAYVMRDDVWNQIKKEFADKYNEKDEFFFDKYTKMCFVNNPVILGGNINIDLLRNNVTYDENSDTIYEVKDTTIKSGPFMLDFSKNHINILYQQEAYDEVIFDKEIIPDLNETDDEAFINKFYKAVYKGNVEFYQYKIDNFEPPKEYDEEGGILVARPMDSARSPALDAIAKVAYLNVLVMKIYDEDKDTTELHVFVPYTSFGLVPRGKYSEYYYLSVPMERVLRIPGREVKVGIDFSINVDNTSSVNTNVIYKTKNGKETFVSSEIEFSFKGYIEDEYIIHVTW